MFQKAAMLKLRFKTSRGLINTEDLFDLPMKGEDSLNSIAIALDTKIKSDQSPSFVDDEPNGKADDKDVLKLEIVKAVIVARKETAAAQAEQAEMRQKLRNLTEKLARAEEREDDAKSAEDLRREIAELQKPML